jgi:hypothetical protein
VALKHHKPLTINQYDFLTVLFCRIREDLQMSEDCKEKLLTDNEECSQALINLMLTGQAVKYLHNGNMIYNNIGKLLVGRFYCVLCFL